MKQPTWTAFTVQAKALLDMPDSSGNIVAKSDFEMRSMQRIVGVGNGTSSAGSSRT